MLVKPEWLIKTLIHSKPHIKNSDLGNNFANFMNNCCVGETSVETLKEIKDL